MKEVARSEDAREIAAMWQCAPSPRAQSDQPTIESALIIPTLSVFAGMSVLEG